MDSKFDILKVPSKHFSHRAEGALVQAIITHAVGFKTINEIFDAFDQYGVSAHYVIPQVSAREILAMTTLFEGQQILYPERVPVIQLVDDDKKSFHAGISNFGKFNALPGCEKGLNSCSIGIEFHSPGYANFDGSDQYTFGGFTEGQKETGIALMKHLIAEYHIPAANVFAHSTIAVGRKTDPGANFFWDELYEHGIGYLPTPKQMEAHIDTILFVQSKLKKIGFNTCPTSGELDEATHHNIDAYIMHYASHLWEHQNNDITVPLLDSLNGFDISFC